MPLKRPKTLRGKGKLLKAPKSAGAKSFTSPKSLPSSPPKSEGKKRRVLDERNHDTAKQVPIDSICERVVALAQVISEKEFYPYQSVLAYRIVEAMLLHEGDTISALISRQSGKTETIGSIVAAILVILPVLARQHPDDWKLNITDDKGVYRGYRAGVKIGIYAPRLDQSEIMFNRVKLCLESDYGKKILNELNLSFDECNGNTIRMGGSRVLCESASEQSKIEGETHHLLICEEAQDISDLKVKKSLHPMVSSNLGTIVKIGTSTNRRCDFYNTIKTNERLGLVTGKKYHFFFPYQVCQRYNSMYRKYVEKEKIKIGEDSDEFRMSYGCLTGDSPVVMSDGSTSFLEEVKVGDKVIGHSGKVRRVTEFQYKGDSKPLIEISPKGHSQSIKATFDHRFYTTDGWVEAENLTLKSELLIPFVSYTKEYDEIEIVKEVGSKRNTKANTIPQYLKLTKELGEFLGWYVAEGYSNKTNESTVSFFLSKKETKEAERIVYLGEKVLGLTFAVVEVPTALEVKTNCKDLNLTLRAWFGEKAPEKKLPEWFLRTPLPFLKSFIRAFVEGDGSYNRSGNSSYYSGISTSSKKLSEQLQHLLSILRIPCSYYQSKRKSPSYIDGREIGGGEVYQLWVYGLGSKDILDKKRTKKAQEFYEKGYYTRRIKSLKEVSPEKVYDITVATDHSFCLSSMVAHNCEWIFERGMFLTQQQLFQPNVAQIGGIFSMVHLDGLPREYSHYKIVAGIDWGRSHDSTVLTLVAVNWNNPEESGNFFRMDGEHHLTFYKKHVVGWWEFLGDNYEQQFWQIYNILVTYPNLTKVVTDSNTCGSPIFDRLDSMLSSDKGVEVVGFNFNPRIKSDGYKSLYADFCGGRLTFPASKDVRQTMKYRKFVGQLLDLQKDYKNGLMVVKHTDEKGAHDDYPDSLMMASWGANTPADSNEISISNENFLFR